MNRKLKLISIISFFSIIVLTLSIIGIVNLNKNKPHSHKLSRIDANSATCTEDGNIEYYKCDCGLCFTDSDGIYEIELKDTIINKTGHHCKVVDEHEASCTEDSIISVKCDDCGYEYTDSVHAVGHAFSAWTVTKEKTCNEAGEEARICEVCNYTETREIPKLNHDYILVDIQNLDNVELSKYECSYCKDISYNEGSHSLSYSNEKQEIIFDCPSNYSFVVYCEENEEYIKTNLRIYDAYYENTQYASNINININYNVTMIEENNWLIEPVSYYESGITYIAETFGDIKISTNDSYKLYFKIEKEEILEVEGKNDEIIFIQKLESQYGGYLPYEVEYYEESQYIYVQIPKIDYINIGDKICIGDICSVEELLYTKEECYFGIVENIYINSNESYTIVLSCCQLSDIFENLDINLNQAINLEQSEINETLKEEVLYSFCTNPEFLAFLMATDNAVEETAKKYNLSAKQKLSDNYDGSQYENSEGVLINDQDFLNFLKETTSLYHFLANILLDCNIDLLGNEILIKFEGQRSYYLTPNEDSKENSKNVLDGEVVVKFEASFSAKFDFSADLSLKKKFFIPTGINYFEASLTQNNKFNFEFDILYDYDKEVDSYYVNEEMDLRYIIESTRNKIYEFCSGNKFGEFIIQAEKFFLESIYYQADIFENTIPLCKLRFDIYFINIHMDLNLYINFDLTASLIYKYSVESKTVSGIRVQDSNVKTYKTNEKKINEHSLFISGDVGIKMGLKIDTYISVNGLSQLFNVGISLEVGVYSNIHGLLYEDFVEKKEILAGYFELGLYLEVSLFYKVIFIADEVMLYSNKYKLVELGYDKVFYEYENCLDEIFIDKMLNLNDYDLLSVKCLDLINPESQIEKLSLDSNYYTISFELENGEYLYIDGTTIYTIKDAPAYFEDKLIINVTSNKKWNKYVKGSVAEFLEAYEITIIHDKTFNILLDNMGIGNEAVLETKYAVIPSTLPILSAEGYTFAGWYYDKELTLPAASGDSITSNVTLYAKWHINLLADNYTFNNRSVVYNGKPHSIYVAGDLPTGVTIEYTNNENINAGEYTVTAHFVDSTDTYALPSDMSAILTINKAEYDMSNISFDDYYTVFDSTVKSVEVSGTLPHELGVSYINNDQIEAGVYTVTASFISLNKNYNNPKDMTANLVIEKAKYDMSNIIFEDMAVVYNEFVQRITIIGELDSFIEVEYLNNENINAGIYEVTAVFTSTSNNYLSPENMVANLTINKATYDMSNIVFDNKNVVYTGEAHRVEIKGELNNYLSVSYTNNNKANVGEYEVIATFTNNNDNYYTPSPMKAILAINKATYDMSNIVFADMEITYNGSPQAIYISGDLPAGVTVSYENNDKVNVGEYEVIATFKNTNANYNDIENMSATLTINKANYDMSSISFKDEIVIYNGNSHSLAISGDLPNGITVSYENNDKVNVGQYSVVAKFTNTNSNYNTPEDMNATLTITKIENALVNVKFENKTVVYNGLAQSIYINAELPEGLTVEYTNNAQTNVGEYEVIAHFVDEKGIYSLPEDMKATLTIAKADYDMSNVKFENKTVIYNNKIQALAISGSLPENVSVSYENNSNINVGTYEVIAVFKTSNSNYNAPSSMIATLKINKASYDMSNVKFENKTVIYNNEIQALAISGSLPENVSVSYENNSNINVGTYEVIAVFKTSDSNYNAPSSMIATLKINKASYDMSGITFTGKSVVYNGISQSIYISGTLPTGLSVSYTNNGKIEVGEYTITAKFSTSNSNYNIPSSITARLTILKADYDMSGITFTNKTVVYNGISQSIYISGALPTGLSVSYTGNSNVNVGVYDIKATFTNTNSNYNTPASKTAKLTITKADYDMSAISFNNKTVVYNGSSHSIYISGSLPAGLSVSYTGNSNISAGEYDVTAKFTNTNSNYNTPASKTAKLTITKANYDMSNIKFYDLIRVYTGSIIYNNIIGSLPNGVSVAYVNNGQTEIGVYNITANFTTTSSNYNTPASRTVVLTIVDEIIIDSFKYDYLSGDLTASLVGYTDSLDADITIPSAVSYLSKSYTVTKIEDKAFKDCSSIDTVTLNDGLIEIGEYAFSESSLSEISLSPSTLEVIGEYAFKGCEGLTTIYVGNLKLIDYYAFGNCSNLKNIFFMNSDWDIEIGSYAFINCTSLTSISIPYYVASIGNDAFYGCSNLISVAFEDGISSIGSHAFSQTRIEEFIAPASLASIGAYAFYDCSSLSKVTLNSGLESLGATAFASCTSLTEIVIPGSIKSISSSLFLECFALKKVDIQAGIKSIESSAFRSCYSLQYLYLPSTLLTIYESAFEGCSSIEELIIPDGVTSIKASAFKDCDAISIINLGTSLTSIGESAFEGCVSLVSVQIPSKVVSIGARAFYGCIGLLSVTLPDNITNIGHSCFYNCTNLSTIEIPSSITTIYSTTFTNCSKLDNVVMLGVTTIEFSAFTGCSSLTTIYYGRTVDDWNNLKLGSYNQNLLSCDVYYYSSTKPTNTTYKYWYYNNYVITKW